MDLQYNVYVYAYNARVPRIRRTEAGGGAGEGRGLAIYFRGEKSYLQTVKPKRVRERAPRIETSH